MKAIKADGVALAFNSNAAENVTVIRRSHKEWYFTFEAYDPHTNTIETYALLTKRGVLRTWADPRLLFAFLLDNYNVTTGRFKLNEDNCDDSENDPGGNSG